MKRSLFLVVGGLAAAFLFTPTDALAARFVGKPKLTLKNYTAKTVTCRVAAKEPNKRKRSYVGDRVTARKKNRRTNRPGVKTNTKYPHYDNRLAICYYPDDYKRHPYKRPHANSPIIAGNLYAVTGYFGANATTGKRIVISCRGGDNMQCTVSVE